MKKKLLFRADGNSKIGLGHIYRLIALAEFYKDEYDFFFLTTSTTSTSTFPKDYKVKLLPSNILTKKEPKWISENYPSSEYVVFLDGYQFDSSYQKELKTYNYKLIFIDDLCNNYMYADVVVNHAPMAINCDYQSEKYTDFALGTKYALLRNSFNEAARQNRDINKIENVFICFGGSDFKDLTLKATNAIKEIKEIKNIHVVVGKAYKHKAIFKIAEENKKINIYKNLDEYFHSLKVNTNTC